MRKGFFARLALQSIQKNRKVYFPYILTAVVTVAMLYIITSLSRNPSLQSETVAFTLGLGVWVTSLFSVVFLFYTNSFLMKRRKKEFGLYNILGMEKKHIGRVVAWETLVILLASLALGFGVGMLLDKLMFLLFVRMLNGNANMTFYVSPYAIVFTACLIGGTFLMIFLNSLRQIHRAKPIELLHGGQVGEREPKAKWAVALLGVLTLGAGYYISVRVTNPVAVIFLFFVAVLLVIVGTYLLFTAGSVGILKLMRKNKRYYYRADHFITVSGMIYRMKQNAVGLGNICILSTMVLVMVFSTVALNFGIEGMVNDNSPCDITLEVREHEHLDDLRALVKERADAAGLAIHEGQSYRYLSFAAYKVGDFYETNREMADELDMFGDSLNLLYFVPLADYNALTGESATLGADEVLISSSGRLTESANHKGDTLSVLDRTFDVKSRFHSIFENGMMSKSVYSSQFIIVNDEATLYEVDAAQRAVYGKHASDIMLYYGFDVDGTDDDVVALYNDIYKHAKDDFRMTVRTCRPVLRASFLQLYGGLFFLGLFLGFLFIMAMILIMYYKQISEGYDDQERYRIMRKVGLSRAEIRRSISSQILTVFFLPLVVAGIHVAFAFPSISHMFRALSMFDVRLEALCALGSFALFALLYGFVYTLTARTYYRIVSAK